MSKRKKGYNRMHDDYNNDRIPEVNNLNNQYFNTFPNYPNMYMNNPQNILENGINFNNLFDFLNNVDIKNLNTLVSLISDGFDINNFGMNLENNYKTYNSENIFNTNESIINFLNSLKPILRVEVRDIIDKFIKFYMDELNGEK